MKTLDEMSISSEEVVQSLRQHLQTMEPGAHRAALALGIGECERLYRKAYGIPLPHSAPKQRIEKMLWENMTPAEKIAADRQRLKMNLGVEKRWYSFIVGLFKGIAVIVFFLALYAFFSIVSAGLTIGKYATAGMLISKLL